MLPTGSKNTDLKEIISYTYPKLYTGADWYVGFYAFDPATGTMKRKKIRLNHIPKIPERKKYASSLINRISVKLDRGWNPWIEAENAKAYHTFSSVCDKYSNYNIKLFNDGNLREKTLYGYQSMLRILKKWNENQKIPITYIYQFNRELVTEFLDYIFMDKDNSIRTRNNYLTWLNVFSAYLVQHMYMDKKPTEGIVAIKRNTYEKDREVIPDQDIIRLRDFLLERNKHYLLACYILHYTLIRPKEMSYLQLSDIRLKKQTIYIDGSVSKNKRSAIVTLPQKVIHLMIELEIFKHPSSYYLFSTGFMPGKERKSEKPFRDYWDRTIRKELKFPIKFKFYSLKDTGITNMLRNCDVISVRDQARHSSILMTNTYTPMDIKEANALLLNYEGIL